MTHYLLRSGGISVLACVASDDASSPSPLLTCTFQVKHSQDSLHATFSLQRRIHVHGFSDEQSFVLLYNADNLVTDTTSYKDATRTLTPSQLAQIARDKYPKVKALSLTLVKPCPILCPALTGSIATKDGHDASFDQLVNLAKATKVTILFDWNWFHPNRQKQFLSLVSRPELFSAFPIDKNNLKGRSVEDWSVFAPVVDIHHVPNESPPSYAEAATKRPRQLSTSSSNSPPCKRILSSLFIPEGSPTEKATTASTPSPKVPFSPVAEASLAEVVRPMLKEMLPGMLTQLLTDLHSSPPPRSPTCPVTSSQLPPSKLSTSQTPLRSSLQSLRALLTARAAARVEINLDAIFTDMVDEADLLRTNTDNEFLEVIADHKVDLQLSATDVLADTQQDMDDKLRVFQEKTAEIIDEAEEEVDRLERESYDKLREQMETLENQSRDKLKAQMERLEKETRDKLKVLWEKADIGEIKSRAREYRERAVSV